MKRAVKIIALISICILCIKFAFFLHANPSPFLFERTAAGHLTKQEISPKLAELFIYANPDRDPARVFLEAADYEGLSDTHKQTNPPSMFWRRIVLRYHLDDTSIAMIYMRYADFENGCTGWNNAAENYFGTSTLSLSQMATLIALEKGPYELIENTKGLIEMRNNVLYSYAQATGDTVEGSIDAPLTISNDLCPFS